MTAPTTANVWQMMTAAVEHHQAGNLARAEALYRDVLKVAPDHPDALHLLGTVATQTGNHDAAIDLIRAALAQRPRVANYHGNLGIAYLAKGRHADAEASLRHAIDLKPDDAVAHFYLGNTLVAAGNMAAAVASFRQTVVHAPDKVDGWANLALALSHQGRFDEASAAYREALELTPGDAELHTSLGITLHRLNRLEQAVEHYRTALELAPDRAESAETSTNLGNALRDLGRFTEALESYDRALAIRPEHGQALAGKAQTFERQADYDAAYAVVRPLVERGDASAAVAATYGYLAKRFGEQTKAADLMERILVTGGLADPAKRLLHFALGTLYDGEAAYDRAFAHFREGNRLFEGTVDMWDQRSLFDAVMATFTADAMRTLPRAAIEAESPVFIVGMPRSGTTLVEQIMASHPEVTGAGELDDIPIMSRELPHALATEEPYPSCIGRLTQAAATERAQSYLDRLGLLGGGTERVTDKMPANFLHLGLIALLFPKARIVHCVRDPLDTCLSCYFHNFGTRHPYSHDLRHLGVYYSDYRRLMAHWRGVLQLPMFEISYEELVEDTERLSRGLIAFLGLEWDDSCLKFYENRRFVSTASFDQVRRPIYRGAVHRWRHYARHIEDLRNALGDALDGPASAPADALGGHGRARRAVAKTQR